MLCDVSKHRRTAQVCCCCCCWRWFESRRAWASSAPTQRHSSRVLPGIVVCSVGVGLLMLMCGVALSLSAPQLCCCILRCCGSPGHTGHCPRGANSAHISHPAACRRHISAGEQLQLSVESREQRSRVWKWATKLSTGHSDDACGVVTSCHHTFQPFLLRTDGDNNSHDLAIFQPSPKCGTKLPTILRVQLQNCQVR